MTLPQKQLEHTLVPRLLKEPVKVIVVGCGGTGSAIASGLPHLHQAMLAFGHPGGLKVTLVDGDRISATNCVRQPFSESEIGLNKATVLANRVNMFYGLGWDAIDAFVDKKSAYSADIVIGCVDSRKARQQIVSSDMCRQATYYLDLGNNADSGQFVLGQPVPRYGKDDDPLRLPTVNELFPEIIDALLDRNDLLPSCSAIEALEKQEPFVNQVLSFHALAMLARLFRRGFLNHHGGFVNIATGKVQSLPVDPEIWSRMRKNGKSIRQRKQAA
jgi:PRTRC genetic system ThiF family protein